jgi:hypothetical protein
MVTVPEMDEKMAMKLLSKTLIKQELLANHQNAIKLPQPVIYLDWIQNRLVLDPPP